MKVLVVGPSPEKSKGGMATVIKGIRNDKNLNRQFEIDIFDSYIDGNIVKRGIYTVLAFQKFKTIYQSYDLFHIHVASYGSTFRKAKYIRFLKKRGKKVILHIHGASYMNFYQKLSDAKKKYVVDTLKCCDIVIALSDQWKARFEQAFGLKNCVALPNGIDTETFVPAITDTSDISNSFLFLGRIGKRKGAYDLVDAVEIVAKKHPEVKLYMAGDGEVEEVTGTVKKKGLQDNIEVVGWVDLQEKKELLKKTATVVLPSYSEGLPMAILEGMAAGKVIISTTVGAIPEVITEENGILIKPGDVHALAAALETCIESREMLDCMSQNNVKKCIECYSIKKTHQMLAEYYFEAAAL